MDNFSPYHCTSERHLARLTGNGASLALAIYGLAFHLSSKSNVFFATVSRLAAYFDADEKTARKAIRLLVKTGFFEELRSQPGKPKRYMPVRHPDWQRKRGGEKACIENGHCAEKGPMPWDDEELDKLGQRLYAVSGGEYQPFPNFIKGMRNTGHSDQAIEHHFRAYIKNVEDELRNPDDDNVDADDPDNYWQGNYKNGFTKAFMKYLRAQPVQSHGLTTA